MFKRDLKAHVAAGVDILNDCGIVDINLQRFSDVV